MGPDGTDAISLSVAEARDAGRGVRGHPRFDRESSEWTFNYVKTETGRYTNGNGKSRPRNARSKKRSGSAPRRLRSVA